jgi:hypothetical protein
MGLKKIFAQRPTGLVAVVLIVFAAFAFCAISSAVVLAAKSAKDSAGVVTDIRIDSEGVKIGDKTYNEHGGITVHVDDEDMRLINIEGESVVRFGDDVIVEEGELVEGDAVAIFGSVLVNGIVEGDAVAVGGSVSVGPKGRIDGDGVAIGGGVTKEAGAVIRGETVSIGKGGNWSGVWKDGRYIAPHRLSRFHPYGPFPWALFSRTGRLFFWVLWTIVIILLALVVTAVVRRPVENVSSRAKGEAFKMGLIGLLVWVLLFPAMVLLAITIIGIPVAILLPMVYILALLMGYTAVGLAVGERFSGGNGKSPYMSVALGILMLQGLSIIAAIIRLPGSWLGAVGFVVAVVGWAVIFVASTVGLGAVVMTRFGTRRPKPAEVQAGTGMQAPQPPFGPAAPAV